MGLDARGRFLDLLKQLRVEAGSPTQAELIRRKPEALNKTNVSDLLAGRGPLLPPWERIEALVVATVLAGLGKGRKMPPLDDVIDQWRKRHDALAVALNLVSDSSQNSTVNPEVLNFEQPSVEILQPSANVEAITSATVDPVFTGRDSQIEQLLAAFDPRRIDNPVLVIAGMGGIGKTSLAKHCAAIAASKGWFTGGVFLVDMLGYLPTPVHANTVFSSLLRRLGIPGERIPTKASDAHAVYHQVLSEMADSGRRVLLIVDNVSSNRQVQPMLPTPDTGHALVATTRDTLNLSGFMMKLDVLSKTESTELLKKSLCAIFPQDHRLTEDHNGTVELAKVCGGLPLALRVAVSLLADEIHLSPAELATQLRTSPGVDGYAFGDEAAVGAVLDLSWQRLLRDHPKRAMMLRLLCLAPGIDVSTDAAAALVQQSTASARVHLRGLRHAHLVQSAGPDRWVLHDLVRLHTTHCELPAFDSDDLHASEVRLLKYYSDTVDQADTHLRALKGESAPKRFSGREDALKWLDDERVNLIAAAVHASTAGHHSFAVEISRSLAGYLLWRAYRADAVTVATYAHNSASFLDHRDKSTAANNLGVALLEVRRFDEAIVYLREDLIICQRAKDLYGEARAVGNLGLALRGAHHLREAIDMHKRDLAIRQKLRDHNREARAWNNLGMALLEIKNLDASINAHRRAIALFQRTSDPNREGKAWNNLGCTLSEKQCFDDAIDAHQRAIALSQETCDRNGEGEAWNNLGMALLGNGSFEESIKAHNRDLLICRELGDQRGEGMALGNIGLTQRGMGRMIDALESWERAYRLFMEAGDRHLAEQVRELMDNLPS